jgi:hypothetical protein
MKYKKLNSAAKQHALEKFSENLFDDWYEYTIEDAKEQGKEKGFEIEEIYFSGFWSQGDGASWKGSVDLLIYVEKNPELFSDGQGQIFSALLDHGAYSSVCYVKQSDSHYSHEHTMLVDDIEFSGYDDNIAEGIMKGAEVQVLQEALGERYLLDVAQGVQEAARDYARKVYRDLEAEYEYQTSEAALLEADYDFDEDGVMQ